MDIAFPDRKSWNLSPADRLRMRFGEVVYLEVTTRRTIYLGMKRGGHFLERFERQCAKTECKEGSLLAGRQGVQSDGFSANTVERELQWPLALQLAGAGNRP